MASSGKPLHKEDLNRQADKEAALVVEASLIEEMK
jgi:hypothetical protein